MRKRTENSVLFTTFLLSTIIFPRKSHIMEKQYHSIFKQIGKNRFYTACNATCSGRIQNGNEFFCGDKKVQKKSGDTSACGSGNNQSSNCVTVTGSGSSQYPGPGWTGDASTFPSETCDPEDSSTKNNVTKLCNMELGLNRTDYYTPSTKPSCKSDCSGIKDAVKGTNCMWCGDSVVNGSESCEEGSDAEIIYGTNDTQTNRCLYNTTTETPSSFGSYLGTGGAESSYIYYGTISTWEVPQTGIYEIEVHGAKGGNGHYIKSGSLKNTYAGCNGALVRAQYKLTKGQKLRLLAGKPGGERNYHDKTRRIAGAGGGGSFVVLCKTGTCTSSDIVQLVIAGGGGGSSPNSSNCTAGQASTSGSTTAYSGGTNGADGTDNSDCSGFGGYGWNDHKKAFEGTANTYTSYMYGEKARNDQNCSKYSGNDPHGGFGGGGSAYYESSWGDAGGGGGYSGGGAGNTSTGGGGGGSYYNTSNGYVSGSAYWATGGATQAKGKIKITLLKYPKCKNDCTLENDPSYSCSCLVDNLENALLYLKFDEGSGSTTANSGTLGGSYSVNSSNWTSSGQRGAGYSFNGSGYITTNDFQYSNTSYKNDFTMMAWVKPSESITILSQSQSGTSGTGGQHYIFGPIRGDGADPHHYSGGGGAGVSVGTNGIIVTVHAASYLPPLAVYSGTLSSYSWYHVAVVFNNKTPYIYLDGNLVTTGYTADKEFVFASNQIGGHVNYGNFKGSMDDVRIIGKALTADEVRKEYQLLKDCEFK